MAQENITFQLPESNLTAVIRGYIPHKVSRKIQEMFAGSQRITVKKGQTADELKKDAAKDSDEVTLTGSDLLKFNEILAKGLAVQIGDHYAVSGALDEYIDDLPEPDFQALLEKAVAVWQKKDAVASPKS